MSSLISRFENFIGKNRYSSLAGALALGILIGFLFFSATYKPEQTNPTIPDFETPENPSNSTSTATSSRGIVREILSNISNIIKPDNMKPVSPAELQTVMAWIYPGAPACGAREEITDGRKINVLKPEYFRIDDGGVLTFLDEENHGCNGYSEENIELIKQYSEEQYVTIASASAGAMNVFLERDLSTAEHTKMLVDFVVVNEFEGVELDFEDFGGWNRPTYENYKKFVQNLGNALHAKNKKLMIDGPATSNLVEENWFVWRYNDFISLPVDYIVIMAYDYQFDHGVGVPVAPLSWIENVISWTLSRFPDKSRLIIGLPSYGYYGTVGRNNPTILTYEEAKNFPGFETAKRDEKSGEMTWRNNNNFYTYQDSESLNVKIKAVLNRGISGVSIWHLGGNNWISE